MQRNPFIVGFARTGGIVNVDIVIFGVDWFFNERFVNDNAIADNVIVKFFHLLIPSEIAIAHTTAGAAVAATIVLAIVRVVVGGP